MSGHHYFNKTIVLGMVYRLYARASYVTVTEMRRQILFHFANGFVGLRDERSFVVMH